MIARYSEETESLDKPETPQDADFESYQVSSSQVLNCSFSSWYPTYRAHIPKSRIIPLPQNFIDYLLEDGIFVPSDGYEWEGAESGSDDETDIVSESNDDDFSSKDPSLRFPELHEKILATIKDMGGAVMPKLNWSAPRDAKWISSNNSLKCVSPSDIYLLLKSSSYITHDLTEAFDRCFDGPPDTINFDLVLRKWVDVNPAVEFRCFVKNRSIIGICQRDHTYYDYLHTMRQSLQDEILEFFGENLQYSFPDPNFVFDVYIPAPHERVWLIDINPYSPITDSLLFDWTELNIESENAPLDPLFRLVGKEDSTRSFASIDHSENRMPREVVQASVGGGIDISSLVDQWKMVFTGQQADSDGESDE